MQWQISDNPVDYNAALIEMQRRVAAIRRGECDELVWLLEHPPLYTAGTSAKVTDLLEARFPVYETGRGGQYTYHGPGQRVAYVMLDLKARQPQPDLRTYIWRLEEWLIRTLAAFGVRGERRDDRIGIWVVRDDGREDKIAAIGVRVRQWVSYHGVALNVNPVLSHYSGIVPCGISDYGVTSLADLGVETTMEDVDAVLQREFDAVFGSTEQEDKAG